MSVYRVNRADFRAVNAARLARGEEPLTVGDDGDAGSEAWRRGIAAAKALSAALNEPEQIAKARRRLGIATPDDELEPDLFAPGVREEEGAAPRSPATDDSTPVQPFTLAERRVKERALARFGHTVEAMEAVNRAIETFRAGAQTFRRSDSELGGFVAAFVADRLSGGGESLGGGVGALV